MSRVCYCKQCGKGHHPLSLVNNEQYNGLADLHFVSELDPRWESFEWSSLSIFGFSLHALAERVLKRKREQFGEPPIDLRFHICDDDVENEFHI
jgi:hypothetical protein